MRSHLRRRVRSTAIGFAVITAVPCILSWFVVEDQWLYVCGRCGMLREETRLMVLDYYVSTLKKNVRRGPQTPDYDDLVGVPHEHEWCPAIRVMIRHRWPFRHETGSSIPPAMTGPPRITAMDAALQALRLARHWPREERIALFEEMLRCPDVASALELRGLSCPGSEGELRNWMERRGVRPDGGRAP
mgnify:CR=1 FL=1